MAEKKQLEDFSTEELLAELDRRRAPLPRGRNADFYFFITDDEPDEYRGKKFYTAGVVHKRFWHLNGHLDDTHNSNWLDLPRGVSESSEAQYSVPGATREEAAKVLLDAGLSYVPGYAPGEDVDCWAGSARSGWLIGGTRVTLDAHCDGSEVHQDFLDWLNEQEEFPSRNAIVESLEDWCSRKGYVAIIGDSYNGVSASILTKEVFDSLPPPPPDEDED